MSGALTLAKAVGIESVAPAAVFAVLYVPVLGWFLIQSIKRPTYVFVILSLFCAIRTTAFIIRAILAGSHSTSVENDLSLLIADQVLFGVGFFGLLYSAYTLVLDRELLSDIQPRKGPLAGLIYNRRLFRMFMLAAVVLGIVGATESTSSPPSKENNLRIASTAIFLVLTLLVAYQTLILASVELQDERTSARESLGKRYGAYVLSVIALLLLVREVFATATITDVRKQNNERLWYPLYALPEILAVVLYATPGLVPPRSELPR